VQHLGGADAVDDVDAEVRLEALAQFGRQRLAGRRHQAQRHLVARGQLPGGQHAGKAGGRAVEHRGLQPRHPRRVQRLKVASGVGRSPISSVVAPTLIGKVSALPRP
jgi:hypothetical protein